jgi:tetratricopeptide (TPR) repeat protein
VQGKLPEAVAELHEALRLQPNLPPAYLNLGNALHRQRKLPEAVAAYREALRLQPDLSEAHHNLGLALQDQGQLAEAVDAYRAALRINPDFALAHCNLGFVLRQQGQFAASSEAFRRGHELGRQTPNWPHPSESWARRAEVLVDLDRRLPDVLADQAELSTAAEYLEFASLCRHPAKRLHTAAVRLFAAAFASDPKRAAAHDGADRYDAACSAALAAAGQAEDAKLLPDKVVATLRTQALQWLRADLTLSAERVERNEPTPGKPVQARLAQWQTDPDLVGVRHPWALWRLPKGERQHWRQFWADVDTLRKRAEAK